ncbi:hypothetical protein B1B04_18765 [Lysinibacillus sp. KCTC 33748]|uniref:hypothetical protein n=1 Tax=unclassified Lysinibacillus TaxID=2636778 RepID=UPI0009A843DB|nr:MULTISPECIES: hypothetical protein [unclassified Lysinibacillus]OXS70207.1 hypothetical protein B1B04_18765 [Lysinibacillus sp. KCTC 33748]SKC04628.1 hypothetical protein SAMN06295926_11941 [Lysinibacillus sp. AC-3]
MNRILEQLYKNLNQEKESLHECAVAVADLSNGQNHEDHIEKLIAYNLQKGRVSSLEDVIHEIDKLNTKPLKVV